MASADRAGHNCWKSVAETLAEIGKLQTDREHRDNTRTHFVEGVRNFVHAADNGVEIVAVVISDRLLKAPVARKLARENRRAGVPCVSVTPEQFRQVSRLTHASGVGAVVRQHWSKLHAMRPNSALCWLAVQTVRSPGNLGTLLRTSEAVGGAGLIAIGPEVDPFDPAVVRSTMGALFRQRLVRTGWSSLRNWVARHHCSVVGASPDGALEYHRFSYRRPTVLMLGDERRGISNEQRALCRHLVRIPMVGEIDSLNLAVAGSLLLYELFRSRGMRRCS